MGRFGTTHLPRSMAQYAKNEEMLVDRDTGQTLIRTDEATGGDIISYDSIMTQSNALKLMRQNAILNGVKGEIYSVDLELGQNYPVTLGSADMNTNLLASAELNVSDLLTGDASRLLLSLDVLTVRLDKDGGVLDEPCKVQYQFKYNDKNGVDETITYTSSAYEVSPLVDTSELGTNVRLTEVSIMPNESLATTDANDNTIKYRNILTNFLIFLEKEGL